jgi:Fe-S-cluster containining protein
MELNVLQNPEHHAEAEPWYAGGLRFTCTQCGNCCTGPPGHVWISRQEVVRVGEYLKLTPQEVVERYCRKVDGRFSLREHRNEHGDYDCIFLKNERVARGRADGDAGDDAVLARRTCAIYPVRPLQCRTWPFWEINLRSEQAWNRSAKRCHGMNHGKRLFSREQVETIRDARDWPQSPPTS